MSTRLLILDGRRSWRSAYMTLPRQPWLRPERTALTARSLGEAPSTTRWILGRLRVLTVNHGESWAAGAHSPDGQVPRRSPVYDTVNPGTPQSPDGESWWILGRRSAQPWRPGPSEESVDSVRSRRATRRPQHAPPSPGEPTLTDGNRCARGTPADTGQGQGHLRQLRSVTCHICSRYWARSGLSLARERSSHSTLLGCDESVLHVLPVLPVLVLVLVSELDEAGGQDDDGLHVESWLTQTHQRQLMS